MPWSAADSSEKMRGRRDFKVRLGGQYNPLIKDKNPVVFVPLHDILAVVKANAF